MSLDGAFIHLITKELSPLIGARVDKIHQPSRDEIIIAFRASGGTKKLLLSANASSPRLGLVEITPENPAKPPMFCMLLRKHLSSGKVIAISQEGLERIVSLTIESTTEIGDLATFTLIIEIMGRHSNIILTKDNRIIDAIKRVSDDMSSVRRVLPTGEYILPPRQDRLNILGYGDGYQLEDVLSALKNTALPRLDKALIAAFEGISPLFAREAAHFVARDTSVLLATLDKNAEERLDFFLVKAKKALDLQPSFTIVRELSGKPKDFSFINIEQYSTAMLITHEDGASALLERFYSESVRQERLKQRSQELLKHLLSTYERISRRVENQKIELAETEHRDKFRIWGDLINANLHTIEKGQTTLKTVNFYDGEVVEIPLDIKLTAVKNAQKYYHEYKKLDMAEKMLTEQIAKGEQEKIYIDSVFDAVSRTSGDSELVEIKQELYEQGYLKNPTNTKGTKGKLKALPPLRFVSSDGFEILAGRNNKQNDTLTLKTAAPDDIWLHTQKIAGSHVIIKTNGKAVSDRTLLEAAIIAGYCSKGRESAQVPVDYTKIRYVKKPNGAKPGMVIFTNNKTLYVTPDEAVFQQLSKN